MSNTAFSHLFHNASEGNASAPIVGQQPLPAWVFGSFLYNGPVGVWDFEKESAKLWFDGQSILQSFRLDREAEVVHYRKRFLHSEALQKATIYGKNILTEYGTPGSSDPEKNLISRMMESIIPGEMTDNCACSFYQLGKFILASTETALLRVVDPMTLETGDKVDMSSLVNVACARPLRDDKGDLYNLAGTFATGIKYQFICFPADAADEVMDTKKLMTTGSSICTIPSRMKTCFSYYHTFGMSENYLVMVEQPWVANVLKLATSRVKGLSFKDCLEWHPEEKNRFHVVEKASGRRLSKTIYMSREPFFFLNFINTFEGEDGKLVVDLLGYDSPDVLDQLYLDKLRSGKFDTKDPSKFFRFILPLQEDDSKECYWLEAEQVVRETGCEHPIVNPSTRGKRCRFTYVVGWFNSVNQGYFANSISKVDLTSGECIRWRGDNCCCHPAEVVFVPNPAEGAEEDDGVIVSPVTVVSDDDAWLRKDFLVFLDAKSMTELARANFDATIPYASHGYHHMC